jgi:large subunit ribosomal protein L10
MPTQKKQQMVEALGEKLKDTNGVILTEYQGMTVSEISELRAKLRALSCEYTVVKNTLASIALKNLGMEEFAKKFTGPTLLTEAIRSAQQRFLLTTPRITPNLSLWPDLWTAKS